MTEIHGDEVHVPDRTGIEVSGSVDAEEVSVPVIELSDGVAGTATRNALQSPAEGEDFGGLPEEEATAVASDTVDDDTDLLDEAADPDDKRAGPVDRARAEVAAAFEQSADELAAGGSGADGIDHVVPPTGGGGNENNGAGDGEESDDADDNADDGQERTGTVMELGESEDNRTIHELSPAEQLNRFHERAAASSYATFNRAWIRDEAHGVEIYIRDGSRPVRRVVDALGEVKIGDETLALQGRCLEISDIKRTGNDSESVNPETAPEFFLQVMGILGGYAENAGLWDAVCIDNLGDPAVSKWCTDNGWEEDPTIPEDLDARLRPDFLFKPLPGRGVVGV